MKGWHRESGRHSLAARGIRSSLLQEFNRSNRNFIRHYDRDELKVEMMPFPEDQASGGQFVMYADDAIIGMTDVEISKTGRVAPSGIVIPPETAITSDICIYGPNKGFGYGRILQRLIEDFARENGMKRLWALDVQNKEWARRMGFKFRLENRYGRETWEKEL